MKQTPSDWIEEAKDELQARYITEQTIERLIWTWLGSSIKRIGELFNSDDHNWDEDLAEEIHTAAGLIEAHRIALDKLE